MKIPRKQGIQSVQKENFSLAGFQITDSKFFITFSKC